MAQGFKLVLRPSKPGEKDSEKKFYAVSKTNGTSSMKTLCKLIYTLKNVNVLLLVERYQERRGIG